MAKQTKKSVVDGGGGSPAMPSRWKTKELIRKEFGERVYARIHELGIVSFAAVADASGGVLTRDNVSRYARGESVPSPDKLKVLAKVLRMSPEVLWPPYVEVIGVDEPPRLSMIEDASKPGLMRLQINRWVHAATARKILDILSQDDASDGSPSGD